MGVLLDPSISWGATACSGGHSACVVFRQLGVPVLETDEDYVWCFGCSFDGANLGIRHAKMEGVPMADTRDAAPPSSAKFFSLRCGHGVVIEPAHRWDKHMIIEQSSSLSSAKLCCE